MGGSGPEGSTAGYGLGSFPAELLGPIDGGRRINRRFWAAFHTVGGGGEVQIFVVVAVFRGGFRRSDASFFLSLEFRVGFEPIR
ncbi:hypothetical protein CASFOL_011367 [Castilleja foliolosa]|uniref:Uncharacterized protein n=1 Tax=Castilleja foliolosa TaxID=1961234 RepID=A0ABD3DX78_9LAMI